MSEEAFCGRCGRPEAGGDHTVCAGALQLEPPRFCAHCGRRMKVQVVPRGWTAECSRHGTVGSA